VGRGEGVAEGVAVSRSYSASLARVAARSPLAGDDPSYCPVASAPRSSRSRATVPETTSVSPVRSTRSAGGLAE
jgi:hypothetical protein